MEIQVLNERFTLLPERVLHWPSEKMLVVADMHLGKAQTFQQSGMWLPSTAHGDDLQTLASLIRTHAIEHIVFLGDFVHSRRGVTEDVIREFQSWRDQFLGQITVVIGNHDRPFISAWPSAWRTITLCDHLEVRGMRFQHEPPTKAELKHGKFVWCGHIHPKVVIRKGPDRLRLPSFVIGERQGFLPAYSSLAGGMDVAKSPHYRFYVIAEDQVLEV